MKKENIHKHYEELANNFDRFWKPSSENFNKIISKIIDLLELKENDSFLDLGCGTGLFTKAISEKVNLTTTTCVDFSDNMLQNSTLESIIKADIVEFFVNDTKHNKILFKESFHHINLNKHFIEILYNKIDIGNIILIVNLDFEKRRFLSLKK